MGEGGGQGRAFAGQAAAWSDAMPEDARLKQHVRNLACAI